MDDNLARDGEEAGTGPGACGLYREVPVKRGAPTESSAFAARQAELGSQQPDMIGSGKGRGDRLGKPGR
jgi:hypothetical protein